MITAKYTRGLIVFLTLLLAAAANLMYFSCDADHDEATPPVIVEFQFLRAHNGATTQTAFLPVGLTPGQPHAQALSLKSLIGSRGEPLSIEQSSAPVGLPLLC